MSTLSLGPTLVTGGCGFLGSHIVRELLRTPEYQPIISVSRNPGGNLEDDVDYRICDLAHEAGLLKILREVKPQTIFHVASPTSTDFNIPMQTFTHGNINGTTILLSCIAKVGSVKVLVFTSTVSVIEGNSHVMAPESAPYWPKMGGDCLRFVWSKVVAEQLVLKANSTGKSGLRTVALRLCLMYGPGDRQSLPHLIDAVKGGQSGIQLGDNSNKIDLLSVTGAVSAHMLAARLLHNPEQAHGQVAGEAFNITDGEPQRFWDFMRLVYRLAGDTTKPEDIKIVPARLALSLANTAEGFYSIITLGRKRPTQLNRIIVTNAVYNHTYDISKARRVLGYQPLPRLEEGLREAIKHEFAERGEALPASSDEKGFSWGADYP